MPAAEDTSPKLPLSCNLPRSAISTAQRLSRGLRELVGEVPGPESVLFSSSLFSAGNPIEVELAADNFNQLLLAVDRLKGKIAEYGRRRRYSRQL